MYSIIFSWIPPTLYVIINSWDKGICHMLGSVSMHFSTVLSRVLGPINILYSVFIYSFFHPWTNMYQMTDVEAEAPILWPPDGKNWLIGKDPDVGKDWRQEEKGMTEDDMVGWYHWLDGNEFEQALRVGDGQGSLVYCSPWGHKKSGMTEWQNWIDTDQMTTLCLVPFLSSYRT